MYIHTINFAVIFDNAYQFKFFFSILTITLYVIVCKYSSKFQSTTEMQGESAGVCLPEISSLSNYGA